MAFRFGRKIYKGFSFLDKIHIFLKPHSDKLYFSTRKEKLFLPKSTPFGRSTYIILVFFIKFAVWYSALIVSERVLGEKSSSVPPRRGVFPGSHN